MTYTALLGRTCTVTVRTQDGPVDDYNVPTWQETATEFVPYARQQRAASELLDQRDTQSGTHELFFLPDVDVDAYALVLDAEDGVLLEVIGPVYKVDRPGTGVHHIQALAREVDQPEA